MPTTEFLEDDAMNDFPIFPIRHNDPEAVGLVQPVPVECLFHGESGAQQANGRETGSPDGFGAWVGDVQQGDPDGGFDHCRDFMQCIGA